MFRSLCFGVLAFVCLESSFCKLATGDDSQTKGQQDTKAPQTIAAGQESAAPVEPKKGGSSAAKPDVKPKPKAVVQAVSFIRDVAPVLVENCIACHNPRKSESKYVMTTFAQLAKGGQQGEGTHSSRANPTRAAWSR